MTSCVKQSASNNVEVSKALQPVNEKQLVREAQWKSLCLQQDRFIAKNPNVRCSKVNKTIHRAVQEKRIRTLGAGEATFKLTTENYHSTYRLLLHAEEAHDHIDMRKYDQYNAKVRRSHIQTARGTIYEYDFKGISKGHPNLIPGDTVILDNGVEPERFSISGIEGDTIRFQKKDQSGDQTRDFTIGLYTISFVSGCQSYDRYNANLKSMSEERQYENMIFESEDLKQREFFSAKIDLKATSGEEVDERLARCNLKQRQAIQNIIEANCRPSLYILFGPPGTGKTFTVVETVVQVYKRDPKAKILISAGSNNCVDHLAEAIFRTSQIKELVRFSSMTHYRTLESAPQYYTLDINKARKQRVVVTTNMMTCKLDWKFDYVLVDEAGHAHVPESMLPMSRVANGGCFVLAGDPKQLGPVIKCREVGKLGLEISLLERLFSFKIYKRSNKGNYNSKYITKLTDSYRCDPRILGLCNKLFYQGDLRSLGKTPPSIMRMFNFKKPLVFSPVRGQEYTPRFSTSRGNMMEVRFCVNLIFRLLLMGFEPHQIGVITPYILQRELLIEEYDRTLQKFKSKLNDRFKLPKQPTMDTEQDRELMESFKSLARTLRAEQFDRPIDDISFLAKALCQIKLQSEHTIERRRVQANASASQAERKDWHCKIDTVDAFQGNEREIIIMSTVRTPVRGFISGTGFLADPKRFNVAISRAKWLVLTVGHPSVLNCCALWRKYSKFSCQSDLKF